MDYYTLETELNKQLSELLSKIEEFKDMFKPSKKSYIPQSVKNETWDKYIGQSVDTAKCLCCNTTDITRTTCHYGHVISERMNGPTCSENIRPICRTCNLSMGTQNMCYYQQRYHPFAPKIVPPSGDLQLQINYQSQGRGDTKLQSDFFSMKIDIFRYKIKIEKTLEKLDEDIRVCEIDRNESLRQFKRAERLKDTGGPGWTDIENVTYYLQEKLQTTLNKGKEHDDLLYLRMKFRKLIELIDDYQSSIEKIQKHIK
jgi:hypothetical protein